MLGVPWQTWDCVTWLNELHCLGELLLLTRLSAFSKCGFSHQTKKFQKSVDHGLRPWFFIQQHLSSSQIFSRSRLKELRGDIFLKLEMSGHSTDYAQASIKQRCLLRNQISTLAYGSREICLICLQSNNGQSISCHTCWTIADSNNIITGRQACWSPYDTSPLASPTGISSPK